MKGDTRLEVVLSDGSVRVLTIEELYNDWVQGQLTTLVKIWAMNPKTGSVDLVPVGDVMQHHTSHKDCYAITLHDGSVVEATEDHSFFHYQGDGIIPVATSDIRVGDVIASKEGGKKVVSVTRVESLPVTYDLCVPGYENFILENGIVAHNSYSIGGISLDIDKHSKYMDLKRNAEEQWDKLVEAKYKTVHYVRGIQQPKYGMGIRSSFGPYTGRGVLSPRKWV